MLIQTYPTTPFAQTLLDDPDAATARGTLGVVIGTNVQAWDTDLDWLAATITDAGKAILDDANAAAQRTTLGLVIGTNVQAWDTDLDALAALATTGLVERTGAGTAGTVTTTAFAKTVLDDADAATACETLSAARRSALYAPPAMVGAFDAATYGPDVANVILNLQYRLGELESELRTVKLRPTLDAIEDRFTTNRAAGAVNGTTSEPSGHLRTVVDTESKLSIAASALTFAGGKAAPAWGDPQLTYPTVTRVAGLIFRATVTPAANNTAFQVGFGSNAALRFAADGTIIPMVNGAAESAVGAYAAATTYQIAVELRASGARFYIRGGAWTVWTLLRVTPVGTVATLTPTIQSYSAAVVVDDVRVPGVTWRAQPRASDGFGGVEGATLHGRRTDGLGHIEATGCGAGHAWVAPTWTLSGGRAKNTPATLSAEALTNGDMETGNPPSNWTAVDVTLAGVADERTGGAGVQSMSVIRTAAGGLGYQDITVPAGTWFRVTGWGRVVDAAMGRIQVFDYGDSTTTAIRDATTTSWTELGMTARKRTGANTTLRVQLTTPGTPGPESRFDDVSVKTLLVKELLGTIQCGPTQVVAAADVWCPNGYQAGFALRLDDETNPANFVLAFVGRAYANRVVLVKCVAGLYTEAVSVEIGAGYADGRRLEVRIDGNVFSVWYNNALIGTAVTIDEAGINSNTRYSTFASDPTCTLDNFVITPIGAAGEWEAGLNQFA